MYTSEVLNRAADLIEERGWSQGNGWFPKADENTPVCAEGAIRLAACGEYADGYAAKDVLDAYITDRYPECINSVVGHALTFSWNDRRDRTQAEVIEVLRAAAVIEHARESQPSELSA